MKDSGEGANASRLTRWLAAFCDNCTLCRLAREKQRGLAYWLVRRVERYFCPFCRAYERVHGRKAFEPDPQVPGSPTRAA